jgi:acyl-CoA reductase-like NAD-dependent aldehyde dehydrogenase
MTDVLHVINPATEELLETVPIDDAAAIAQKVERSRSAQPAWRDRPFAEKAACLETFRDLLIQHQTELAATLTAETGKPIRQSLHELQGTPARIDFFIQHTPQVMESRIMHREPADSLPGTATLEEILSYDPLGTIANISAWNYPYFVGVNVFVAALLTGNTVLYKPSEFSTLTGLAIAALMKQAGVPEDVFTPIIGGGQAGAALMAHPLDGVFFTGSHATGMKIAAAAAQQLAKVQLELGGKDPVYICEDVDVDTVAPAIADGAFYNNGQSCCAVERIYVHHACYDAVLDRFLGAVAGLKLGDPTDPRTDLGPLSRRAQRDVLQRHVDDALAQGATLRCGGQAVDRPGWYFAPTVLTEVTHSMAVMREESFGPIIGIQRVSNDQEAIALMNDTAYGLTASVYCRDRQRASRILHHVRSGTAYWNCCDRVSPYLPWTGRGQSGYGSTLSLDGIRSFIQPRAWHLRQG